MAEIVAEIKAIELRASDNLVKKITAYANALEVFNCLEDNELTLSHQDIL